MRKGSCADVKKELCRSAIAVSALALALLPVAAERVNVDKLKGNLSPQVLRGGLNRSPHKSIHRFPATNEANAWTKPSRPPVFSFFEPSSRSGSVNYGFMIGTSPFSPDNVQSSSVQAFVAPVVIVVHQVATDFGVDSNGNLILTGITNKDMTFDPTKPSQPCLGKTNNVPFKLAVESPVYQKNHWVWGGTDVGYTQYVDAFQRANFWRALGDDANAYHVLLDPVQVLPPVVFDFPIGSGIALPQSSSLLGYSNCAPTVLVDFSYFDDVLDYLVLPKLAGAGVNASTFPMFIAGNVLWGQVIGELPIFNAEAAGYHSFSDLDPSLTYGVTQFGDEGFFTWPDAMPLSHEVGEWMNDPTGVNDVQLYNVTPSSTPTCQGNYEVGDILTGTFMPPVTGKNGYSYTLQELAFFSYFYGGPSLGVNGWYSNNNTLTTDAGTVCSLL
jgi:hypothetical protein